MNMDEAKIIGGEVEYLRERIAKLDRDKTGLYLSDARRWMDNVIQALSPLLKE